MEYFGIVKEQKWVEEYVWNKITFNKYLIKFEDDETYYEISRNKNIEQALIGANIVYSIKNFDNDIGKHRIVAYSTNNDEKYYLISHTEITRIANQYYNKGMEKQK